MLIRPTTDADLPFLDPIFDQCRAYMKAQGNPTQWDEKYPTSKVVAEDIKNGTGFVCVDEKTNEILGSFALANYEEQYDHLYDGKWSKDEPYTVVHRMAAIPEKGAGQFMFEHLKQNYNYIRIDTHEANQTMLHILKKTGFVYCGKVSYAGYGERVAFDFSK